MLHESAAFSVVLSHSCPPRRATRSVVLSHKISTPPACWPANLSSLPNHATHAAGVLPAREERKNSDKVKFRFDCLQHGSRLPKKYLGTMKKQKKISRGLYWRDPTVNSCPKEKPPGSPRTFSTVLYPRTSSLRAKQDRPCPFPFSIPPPSLLCSNRV
ncbi:hypothetical protein OSB04_un000930 [Centaurea solstitialis]|uniref:Uncharacterized protein n=1 Tax=Centaurea solstitialis TaxID=347529 RepID=A0AA38S5A9_9ASTR|nr:hypothetical protein OSB04_un000930 [Centaurea solstitialis]